MTQRIVNARNSKATSSKQQRVKALGNKRGLSLLKKGCRSSVEGGGTRLVRLGKTGSDLFVL